MPGSIVDFLKSVVLVHSYNGAWWFLNTYIILMIIPSIVLFFSVRKINSWIGIIGCIGLSFVYYILDSMGYISFLQFENPIMKFAWKEIVNLIRVLPYFYVGAFLCKGKIVDEAKRLVDRYMQKGKNTVLFLWFVILFVGVSIVHKAVLVLIVAIIVFLMFNIWEKGRRTEKVFLFLGKHSTNIWLTHMFFYLCVFQGLVQKARYPIAMFLFIMLLCCGVSEVVIWIHKKIVR